MAPLDTKASRALEKLCARQVLDQDERVAWTQFLLSLLFRNRETVGLIKTHMADICREAIRASESDWVRLRKPEETRPLVEAMADRELGMSETHAERIMRQIIGEHRAQRDIMAMRWTCVDVSRSDRPLLTSDRPIMFGSLSIRIAISRYRSVHMISSLRRSMIATRGNYRSPTRGGWHG